MNNYAELKDSNTTKSDAIENEMTLKRYVSMVFVSTCTFPLIFVFVLFFVIIGSQSTVALKLKACPDSLQLKLNSGCNGDEALCVRTYNNVAYATMHNAFATSQDGFAIAQHRACMRSGLTSGIRAFMLDVHLTASGELKLCHALCSLGSSSLTNALSMFAEFLRLNPREIVTIIWEFGVDGRDKKTPEDKASLKRLLGIAMRSTGLFPYLYSKEPGQVWPTLNEMIAKDSRLVSLTDTWTSLDESWDMYMWDYTFETKFDSKSQADLDKSCVLNRGSSGNALLILNHFTIVGAIGIDTKVTDTLAQYTGIDTLFGINQEPYMWNRISDCAECLGRFPNFVTVDFWESSDVIPLVKKLNSVTLPSNQSKCIY